MSLEDLKKEVACGCDYEEPDPRLMASLELLSVLERLIENLMYSGLAGLDEETAQTRKPVISMQIGFVREAAGMLEPALKTIEQYLAYVGTPDTTTDPGGGMMDEMMND
jgi:hypothetical protein